MFDTGFEHWITETPVSCCVRSPAQHEAKIGVEIYKQASFFDVTIIFPNGSRVIHSYPAETSGYFLGLFAAQNTQDYILFELRSEYSMPRLDNIKPISYFKAHAAEMLDTLRETGEPYVITQNGEAAAVLVDARVYEQMEQALHVLRLVQMGEHDVAEGKTLSVEQLQGRLEQRRRPRFRTAAHR